MVTALGYLETSEHLPLTALTFHAVTIELDIRYSITQFGNQEIKSTSFSVTVDTE